MGTLYFMQRCLKEPGGWLHDFLIATQTMTQMSGWDERTEETDGASDPEKNINVARRAFEMLICARLFVLKHLLEKLPPGTDAKTARRRWVLVQAMPPFVRYPTDIFATVLQSLRCADSRDMADLIKSMLADMTKISRRIDFPLKPAVLRCDRRSPSSCGVHERIFSLPDHRDR
jgi:hypothetical protein